jgi:large subunit ribosomal protein L1
MPGLSKRRKAALAQVDSVKRYTLDEALELLQKVSVVKFDESVDIAVRLGVNPRLADQNLRGAVSLPHGIGKSVRVLAFATGDAAREAEEAGADFVGGDDLIKKIQSEGWVDFEKAVAVRTMMAKVGRLGRILGPRGLMPNPKTGTVVAPDAIGRVVRELKGGRIDFRVERAGIIHAPVGKVSMGSEKLRDNILTLVQILARMKPASAKGTYFRGLAISSTMGPGIKLDPPEVVRMSAEYR